MSEVVASVICDVLAEQGVDVVRMNDLVELLREDSDDCGWCLDQLRQAEHGHPSVFQESLQSAADHGSAPAHYAIALLTTYELPDDEDDGYASAYWSQQRRVGVELLSAKAEWADEYDRRVVIKSRYKQHLRAAAALGYDHALVHAAEHFSDPTVFDSQLDLSDEDPIRMAELARSLGRPDQEKNWLTIAAEDGETEAMRDLIEAMTPAICRLPENGFISQYFMAKTSWQISALRSTKAAVMPVMMLRGDVCGLPRWREAG